MSPEVQRVTGKTVTPVSRATHLEHASPEASTRESNYGLQGLRLRYYELPRATVNIVISQSNLAAELQHLRADPNPGQRNDFVDSLPKLREAQFMAAGHRGLSF